MCVFFEDYQFIEGRNQLFISDLSLSLAGEATGGRAVTEKSSTQERERRAGQEVVGPLREAR